MKQKAYYAIYSDEQYCREIFKELRLSCGIQCKKCGGKSHYWMEYKQRFRCKNQKCRFETTLKSGTILQDSKLSIATWFEAIFLMFNSKKGMSIKELQRQMGIKYYQVAHSLSHKIRKGTSHLLKEFIYELSADKQSKEYNPAKFTDSPVNFKLLYSKKTGAGIGCLRFIQFNYKESIALISNRQPKFKVFNAYDYFTEPNCKKVNNPAWFVTIYQNAKRVISGIHHHVSNKYQQFYLDEYCLKLNLRKHNIPWHTVLKMTVQSF